MKQTLEQWCEVRETSQEIGEAIWEIAKQNEQEAQRIWDDPTNEEFHNVIQSAFSGTNLMELDWGQLRVKREKI